MAFRWIDGDLTEYIDETMVTRAYMGLTSGNNIMNTICKMTLIRVEDALVMQVGLLISCWRL